MDSAGMTMEKLSGPARGYFLAFYACPMGELGKHHLGYYKICTNAPVNYLDAECIDQGCADHVASTAVDALLAAEVCALIRVCELRPLPDEQLGKKLLSCVYISSAASRFRSGNLTSSLPAASHRNRLLRITSVLAHDAGNFMQYLEGPSLTVERMVTCIKNDRRHKGHIELIREPVVTREFPHWPLKFFCWEARKQADARCGEEVFSDADTLLAIQPSAARTLLMDFWGRARR